MKTITLIAGNAQHGKDFTAATMVRVFQKAGESAVVMHYADLLKYFAKTYFGWDGRKDEKGRTLLQVLGSSVREEDPDFWVNAMLATIQILGKNWDHVIIADCRYPNEIEVIKGFFEESKVMAIRVIRPDFDNGLTEEQKHHSSETALTGYRFDQELINSGDDKYLKVIIDFMESNF